MPTQTPKSWIKPSTRRFFDEGRQIPGYSLKDYLHGYIYARWPYLYIGLGTGEHPLAKSLGPFLNHLAGLFVPGNEGLPQHIPASGTGTLQNEVETFADTYHGKVVPLEAARQLVTVHEEVALPDLEHIIPYQRARALILENPDHIAVLECPCRSARENPCLPLDVCLIIGEPFAGFIMEHHPERARWISQEQAVEILQAEDEAGHVHHAFFKDAMLGRFYAICNCCSCCCGAMQAQQHGTPMLASSGYVCQVDEVLCIGCGDCNSYCQFDALSLQDGISQVNMPLCMGCGVCVSKCENGALSLVREPAKGEPLEIQALMASIA